MKLTLTAYEIRCLEAAVEYYLKSKGPHATLEHVVCALHPKGFTCPTCRNERKYCERCGMYAAFGETKCESCIAA